MTFFKKPGISAVWLLLTDYLFAFFFFGNFYRRLFSKSLISVMLLTIPVFKDSHLIVSVKVQQSTHTCLSPFSVIFSKRTSGSCMVSHKIQV